MKADGHLKTGNVFAFTSDINELHQECG